MECAGATVTRLAHLEHELNHSYFGRCVMPANGAAGWVDEGIATWIDAPPSIERFDQLPVTECGCDVPWTPGGIRDGYFAGAALLSLVEHRLRGTDRSVDGFLRRLLQTYAWRAIDTPAFLTLLREYAGPWVDALAERAPLGSPTAEPISLPRMDD